MDKKSKKPKTKLLESRAAYQATKACLVTGSPMLAEQITGYLGDGHVKVKRRLADAIGETECPVFIVDTRVDDMGLWPAPILLEPGSAQKPWLFLIDKPNDVSLLSTPPADSTFFERRTEALGKLASHLQNLFDPQARKKIERVQYVKDRRTFIIRMQNGRAYPLRVDDLPEADSTEVTRWALGRGRHSFKVVQESGNWFEVPWDDILYHCEPEYEYYKGKQEPAPGPDRAQRIGNKVRELRARQGLSITELAERSGMKRPNLSRLEHGLHLPSLETLQRVADALGVPVAELVAERTG